jgi:hypothetical protein
MALTTTPRNAFELGEPAAFAGLTIVPLYPAAEPRAEYVGLDEALARGLAVTEVDAAGAVEALLVDNPLDEHVLLYEGEQLLGAKQDRIVRRTALAGPRGRVQLPVTCVERGRWSQTLTPFVSAPHAAYPELRRRQHEAAAQASSWESVRAKATRLGVHTPTDAAGDVYTARRASLDAYASALPRLEGQSGAIVGIGGRLALLDYVGRSDVFAGLYAKLLRGYALDALEAPNRPLGPSDVRAFVRSLERAEGRLVPAVAEGSEAGLDGGVVGRALVAFGELVALTAHPRT